MKTALYILVGIAVVGALTGFIYGLYLLDKQARDNCLKREGRIENYTTHSISCSTTKTGSSYRTDCHPITYHHWRCVEK